MRTSCSKTTSSGFTLIEVMVAIAIIGIVATVVLAKRIEIVDDTGKTKNLRIAWGLASEKMGQIEMDIRQQKVDESRSDSGSFDDEPSFKFEYRVEKEEIVVSEIGAPEEKKEDIFKINLVVSSPDEEKVTLQSYFPKTAAK